MAELSITELRRLRNKEKAEREQREREAALKMSSGLGITEESLKRFSSAQQQRTPAISAGGEDIKSAMGGTKTISQERRDFLRNLDVGQLTPFQISTMGGKEALKKEIEEAKKPSDAEISATSKKQPAKPSTSKSTPPPKKQEPPKPDTSEQIWRVLRKDGKSDVGTFYETKEQAEEALRKLGGKSVGAVAGIRFPGKTKTESATMREEYMQRIAQMPEAQPATTKEGRIRERLARGGATAKQQEKFLENLARLEAGRTAREAESKEKGKQFWANIEAKKAAEESLNIYKRQVSGLRRAYRQARSEGNELAAFQINELLNEYQRGVPKEEGAKRKAAIEGTIERRNIEFNERRKRAEEEKQKRASLYSANPDAPQFDSTSSAFEPISLTYQ